MENREENHGGGTISKKLKSLDLHGLHEENSAASIRRARTSNAQLCVSRETRPTESKGVAPGRSKRNTCSRDLSPSAFQSVIKRHRKDSGISRSFTHGLDSGIGKGHNLNGSSGIPCISQSAHSVYNTLAHGSASPPVKKNASSPSCSNVQDQSTWGGEINIPRRPRGVLRRRNSLVHIKDEAVLFTSTVKSSSGAHSSKLSGDLSTPTHPVRWLVGNRNKRCHEYEENGPSGCDSVQCFKWENGSSVQLVQKRAQRNHRSHDTTAGKPKHLVSGQLSFEDATKFSDNCHEDDEESLEQNAARMLSSRFDPRCTGHSGDKSRFALKSLSKASSSVSSSLDVSGRVLRPRKQNEKACFQKRRHFYEVCSTGVDPYWVLKRRIRVFWPLDQSWYFGLVKDYDPKTKLHHVKYDDRDEEWINLQNERFKLLLLPSEFSHKFDSEKVESKAKQENEAGIANAIDDNCMSSFLESEPIISWLARSAHRLKTSSLKILKEKRKSCLKNNLHSSLLESQEHALGCPSSTNFRKPSIFVMPDRSTDEKGTRVTPLKTQNCYDDTKFTFVYFRKRFHQKRGTIENNLEESPWCLSDSTKLADFLAVGFGTCEDSNVTLIALKQRQGTLKFLVPLQWLPSLTWLHENSWLYRILSFHYHGKLMIVWPIFCMEIVFLDNTMGLRFLSFKGYLQHAVVVMCLFIRMFHQPKKYTKFSEFQMPFTSIGFRLSCVQSERRQLLFYVYNFLDTKSSRWIYIGRKLKQLAVTVKELPISKCTYANMKDLLCDSERRPLTSQFWEQITLEGLQRRSCKGFIHHLDPKISANSDKSFPHCTLNGQNKSCPFSLPFSHVPALFLFLHFKLLVQKNDASMSSKIPDAVSLLACLKNNENFTAKCCSHVEDSPDKFPETTHENLGFTLNHAIVSSSCLSCSQSKLGIDTLSVSNDCDLMRSCDISLSNELNLNGNSAVHRELGKHGSDEPDSQFQRHPLSSTSWQCVGDPCSPLGDSSSAEESEGGCGSFSNAVNVQTQTSQSEDNVSDRGVKTAGKSTSYLTWSTNGCTAIHSPKPTAPRTVWHRNRQNHVSSSVVHHSKLWPEDWEGFINSYKKPRTQLSYVASFGGYDIGSKSQSHHRKERPYRKLKPDIAKKTLTGPKSLESDFDSLTCSANVLVTAGDRGWREYGAQVLLESDDQKDWLILVKLSGAMKYSYKAHQFWQPGTTNRFTHAMMWKGGKDWTLEFTDRNQWSLFKELYEECHNRNIRAASVKNIPIPGVRWIEDCDDFASEVPFVRSSPKYFRQLGTEVDMALDPAHILYDMDSEDEEWISKLRNSADNSEIMLQGISEEMFEKAMDMFEKVAFERHCDEFTDAEIDSFISEVGPTEVMKAVHEHWWQKRQKKGMPLIRQFQPALWEQYQQQVKEWESTVSKVHNSSNGCHDKAFSVEKPPMFAFCLRPRGLEVPKQRSHKKFPVNGHYTTFARESYSLQGKRLNGYSLGKDKTLFTAPNYECSDVTTWLQSPTGFSPRDLASGLSTFAHGSSDRSHLRLERNHSKRMGMSVSPRDHVTVLPTYAQRTKGSGIYRLNPGFPERFPTTQYKFDGFHGQQADIDEFMLRDASGAAQHASNMAKLKREKAQWLMHKADLAIHRAVVALMTADAIKACEDTTSDG